MIVESPVAPHDGHHQLAGPDRTGTAPVAAAGVLFK